MRPLVVAVDGPSGSGKSSVCRAVAQRLGLAYLDTGAMYRAATWWCLAQGLDLADQAAVADAVTTMQLAVGLDPAAPTVHVAGRDVAAAIREPRVSETVSAIAVNRAVRAELGRRQREIIAEASGPGIVAEGRDITTVVAPDADVRILLTASPQARLLRRTRELHGAADGDLLARTHDQVVLRDARDATVVEFQVAADGVVTVDSTELDLEQTVQAVLRVIEEAT